MARCGLVHLAHARKGQTVLVHTGAGGVTMTGGRGMDIVLNSLAGEALNRSWECVAPSGHFIEIGLRDIVDNTRLGMRPFMRGASFCSVNLQDLWE